MTPEVGSLEARAALLGNLLGGLALSGFDPWPADFEEGVIEEWITSAILETGARPALAWDTFEVLTVLLRRLGLCAFDAEPADGVLELVLPLADDTAWPRSASAADALHDRIVIARQAAA